MFTSVISMPSAASWLFSLRQKAHQVVVYIVSGCATAALPIHNVQDNFTNATEARALPGHPRRRRWHAEVCPVAAPGSLPGDGASDDRREAATAWRIRGLKRPFPR